MCSSDLETSTGISVHPSTVSRLKECVAVRKPLLKKEMDMAWKGHGKTIQLAIMTLVYASTRAPLLIYNGQEVGEMAEGPGGFGGHDGKTSIFDYTCLQQLQGWVADKTFSGSRLTKEEKERRDMHARILKVMSHPAMIHGEYYGLNWANMQNMTFGRQPGENA